MTTLGRPRWLRLIVVALALAVVTAACAADDGVDATAAGAEIEDYPDSITREIRRLAAAPRPVERSALPPRHLDEDVFPEVLVDRFRIVSGGPPPDGIPAIDTPRFEPAADVDWIEDTEPVMTLALGDDVRAYPLQIMTWHEIVNDVVDGVPVVVTYCPLCNSGIAFARTVDAVVLDFGTSGALFQSALVMYDRQTESLWTHFDGRSVVGDLVGAELELLPTSIVSWRDFLDAHPQGSVLGPDDPRQPYGQNPYGFYDRRDAPVAGFFTGEVDDRLEAMARVVGVRAGGEQVAVSLDRLETESVVELTIGGRRAVVWHLPGTSSALDGPTIAGGGDVGATGAFFTDREFVRSGDRFIDDETSSSWNVLGTAIDGEAVGATLEPVDHVDTFWFAWSTYHPESDLAD